MSAHCLVLLLFLMPQTGHGATVYRVGGNAGSSDIHLSWTELATGFGGDWKSLNMDERIEPIFLKPDRNFALEALDGGRPPLVRKQTINFLAWVSDPIVNSTVDGNKTTGFAEEYLIEERQFPRFLFDLGGRFPINRVVFYPRPEHQDRFVENFRVYVFDGDPRLLDGGNFLVQWNQTVPEIPEVELVHEAERNRSPHVDVTLPLRQSTHLILDIGDPGASFRTGSSSSTGIRAAACSHGRSPSSRSTATDTRKRPGTLRKSWIWDRPPFSVTFAGWGRRTPAPGCGSGHAAGRTTTPPATGDARDGATRSLSATTRGVP